MRVAFKAGEGKEMDSLPKPAEETQPYLHCGLSSLDLLASGTIG
jgi:hypothetical protein